MKLTQNVQLSPNFQLNEFMAEGSPLPPPWVLDNLYRLANRLQAIRDIIGKPIKIHSGFRTVAHNQAVGGTRRSLHMSGLAADISVEGMTPLEVQVLLKDWSGGLGAYPTHTHVDIRVTKVRW